MGVPTALEWLGSCSGCEIAILNIGEALVPIITEALDIVHAPVLMDHKYFGQCGEGVTMEIPEATVGIVTGAAQRAYREAVTAGLDAFITGEPTEWVLHQAAEDGVHFIAAGHYATERFGVLALGRWLQQQHGLEVEFVDLPNPV